MAVPHLVLMGYGVSDSLQLTVESQRVLARFGSAYSIGLPANLAAFLKSQRVKVTDLAPRLGEGRDFGNAYLDIAHHLVERTAHERPVIFLAPGNPLIFNAIGRYLAMEGKRLGLTVQALPAVSPLDLVIAGIGLDVSTFGLQVFDATRLVARRIAINPGVPAVLMHAGGFAAAAIGDARVDLKPLAVYLSACYPPSHPVVVVRLGFEGLRLEAVPLEALPGVTDLDAGTHLFIDAARHNEGTPA